MTKFHPHCGQCSQCLDRRFAVLAAGQGQEDPEEAYKVDLFSGSRPPGPDREMALAFIRSASKTHEMEDVTFFAHYGETSRIVGFFPETADTVAGRVLDLHRRHASAICRVVDEAISAHAADLRQGKLPATCLLSLVVSQEDGQSASVEQHALVEPADTIASEIRIAIDEKENRIIFDRWGEMKGRSAALIISLAEPFRQAMREARAPERYPFTQTSNLMSQLGCDDNQVLRRRVLRCRNAITRLAANASDPQPSIDAVIESSQWHGYRLNPTRLRIVALSDIRMPP